MKTRIRDSFPFEELDCQFFLECKYYQTNRCLFGRPCYRKIGKRDAKTTVRELLRKTLEGYVTKECLKYQIENIENK